MSFTASDCVPGGHSTSAATRPSPGGAAEGAATGSAARACSGGAADGAADPAATTAARGRATFGPLEAHPDASAEQIDEARNERRSAAMRKLSLQRVRCGCASRNPREKVG